MKNMITAAQMDGAILVVAATDARHTDPSRQQVGVPKILVALNK